jgi:hypothetical protein
MQNKSYTITAMIDGWEFALAQDVPEEEVEGELQHLTRRHEYKNVVRFEIVEQSETQTAYPRPSGTEKEGVGRSASGSGSYPSDDRLRPSERSE